MEQTLTPQITSFILRFIHEEPPAGEDSPERAPGNAVVVRGVIRNIQTNEEILFTRWQDAVDFIQHFVPLELEN